MLSSILQYFRFFLFFPFLKNFAAKKKIHAASNHKLQRDTTTYDFGVDRDTIVIFNHVNNYSEAKEGRNSPFLESNL